jgi:predicted dehydrogenase
MEASPFETRAHKPKFLRVGLVGCGNIAKHHLRFIHATRSAEVVGLADIEIASARRLGAQCRIQNIYSSLEELLDAKLC